MEKPLKVIHCLRAPVGGLFRHVCDLARGQAERGLEVGIICDAFEGEGVYEAALSVIAGSCALGVHRHHMHRQIALSDLTTALSIRKRCKVLDADIVHGHGAKGGAYARFATIGRRSRAFYTPHGGSLHYDKSSAAGLMFLTLERLLSRATDGLIFESAYGQNVYDQKVGRPSCPSRIIHNGVTQSEFVPVTLSEGAAEFLFIGELRMLKGIDVLLEALAVVLKTRNASAVVVGSGPDADKFKHLAKHLGIETHVEFRDAMPARKAFAMGTTLVVPSRAESFPYIVLEALAAAKPVIATDVGGIPEMYSEYNDHLIAPGDTSSLADAMLRCLEPASPYSGISLKLQQNVRTRFTTDTMVDSVLEFYRNTADAAGAAKNPISAHRSATG